MQATRQRDTQAEMAIRRLLHGWGLRYRVDRSPLPGFRRRADIVFPRERVAVFVDGCFWHRCPTHGTQPKANSKWWRDKLRTNVVRDRDTDNRLKKAGWQVLRIWEHERPEEAAEKVRRAVLKRRRLESPG